MKLNNCKTNIVIVINENKQKVLMCLRAKNPYKGKLNFVGGKILDNESGIESAYRELVEETGIRPSEIELKHLMDIIYISRKLELKVYYGILDKEIQLKEEVNELCWVDLREDFFDLEKYAGEGNIGHMIEQVLLEM